MNRSLELLDDELVGSALGQASTRISQKIYQGFSLEKAVACEPAFTRLQQQVVALGVHTGALHLVLLQLAEYEEHRQQLIGKFRASLIYPALVMVVCLVFVITIPTFAFQGLFQMLEESGQDLSVLTRAVAWLAETLRSPWCYLGLMALALVLWKTFSFWLDLPNSRIVLNRFLEKLPVLGPVLISARTAHFARALSLVIHSGYHLDRGLKIACQSCGSPIIEAVSEDLVERLRQGETLTECFRGFPLFPPLFCHSIAAGEEVGEVAGMLDVLAQVYELELEERLSRLSSVLEPLVMIVLGFLTAVLVLACIKPMAAAFSQF